MTPRRRQPRASTAADHVAPVLDRIQQVRALAHPLRLRLLEVFAEAPHTTMQAAELLGESPTRLYHHVYAMEKAGLLRLKETRPNRGTVEKYFEAVSRKVEVDPAVFMRRKAVASRSTAAIAGTLADAFRQDLEVGLAQTTKLPEDLRPLVARLVIRAGPEKIRELRRAVVALLTPRRKGKRVTPAAECRRYALTIGFLPAEPAGGPRPAAKPKRAGPRATRRQGGGSRPKAAGS